MSTAEEEIDLSPFTKGFEVWKSDFTVGVPRSHEHFGALADIFSPTWRSYRRTVDRKLKVTFWASLEDTATKGELVRKESRICRVNASCCSGSTFVSITCRVLDEPKWYRKQRYFEDFSAFSKLSASFTLPTRDCCEEVMSRIDPGWTRSLEGMIVIAGGTGCGKSSFLQPLVLDYIRDISSKRRINQDRIPHLLVIDDPIEDWKVYSSTSKDDKDAIVLDSRNERSRKLGFNFTARDRGRSHLDVDSLEDALKDAKRQTPSCVVVGEVRSDEDWRNCVDFAGTGHLIVVTTHADSLTETLAKMFQAHNANTPSQRGELARRLLAVIHLQSRVIDKSRVVLPSIWSATTRSINDLVCTGLSSVVPNGEDCLSSTQIAFSIKNRPGPIEKGRNINWLGIEEAAIQMDLKAFFQCGMEN